MATDEVINLLSEVKIPDNDWVMNEINNRSLLFCLDNHIDPTDRKMLTLVKTAMLIGVVIQGEHAMREER